MTRPHDQRSTARSEQLPADITVHDTASGALVSDIVALSRETLTRSVPAELSDDRFDERWASGLSEADAIVAVLHDTDDRPLAYAGAVVDLHGTTVIEVLVALDANDRAELASRVVAALCSALDERSAGGFTGRVEVWVKPEIQALDLTALGFEPYRRLHQMRVPLPLPDGLVEPLDTRAFQPGVDDEAVVTTNNCAFAHHPVQGALTLEAFRQEAQAEWFRADGLRIAEIDGRMAGFCWTKIHPPADGRPALAEIYVICVDPDFHGRGLGRPMTGAGLTWLVEQGLDLGMLYVEADNVPAIRTYEGMGFSVVRSDTAWVRPSIR